MLLIFASGLHKEAWQDDMAKPQKSEESKASELFSLTLWKFRLLAVNPGKNTFCLILILAGVLICLAAVFVFLARYV